MNNAMMATLESDISKMLLKFAVEPNDDTTRWHVYSLLHHHLLGMQNKSTIADFVIVCDESNNPQAVIDSGILQADIAIKTTTQQQFTHIPIKIISLGASHLTDGTKAYDRAMKGI